MQGKLPSMYLLNSSKLWKCNLAKHKCNSAKHSCNRAKYKLNFKLKSEDSRGAHVSCI